MDMNWIKSELPWVKAIKRLKRVNQKERFRKYKRWKSNRNKYKNNELKIYYSGGKDWEKGSSLRRTKD
jgi:hypothetical protein